MKGLPSYSILGLARSGVAAANALHRRGASVIVSDLRGVEALAEHIARLEPGIEVALGENVLRDGDTIVVSPGIPPRAPVFAEAEARGLEVVGEVALFQRLEPKKPILAVTGTDGKSTTTAWLGAMCEASGRPTWVGGNIGVPLCESVDRLEPDHLVIAEVSCFQLSTAAELHPRVAILTNIAPDHLDYYSGSLPAYVAAKRRLLANLALGESAVLNRDDATLRTWSAPRPARTLWYSRSPLDADLQGVFVRDGRLVARMPDELDLIAVDDLPIPGSHNVENALAATCGALAWGIPAKSVCEALRSFGGLEHRIERIRTVDGVTWYNDSKATNPHAGEAALRAFEEKIVLIAGGSKKGSDFDAWADLVADHVRHAVLCGDTADRIEGAIAGRVPVTRANTLADATLAARHAAGGQGVIVLSPACASFDQFQSYEHRGREFKRLVHEL